MPGGVAIRLVPFAVNSSGHMGQAALELVPDVEDVGAASDRIDKGMLERWAMQVLFVTRHCHASVITGADHAMHML